MSSKEEHSSQSHIIPYVFTITTLQTVPVRGILFQPLGTVEQNRNDRTHQRSSRPRTDVAASKERTTKELRMRVDIETLLQCFVYYIVLIFRCYRQPALSPTTHKSSWRSSCMAMTLQSSCHHELLYGCREL